jgi:hypothetical protein
VDQWKADASLPSDQPNGDTSTRRTLCGVALRPGDEIRIEAVAQGEEAAALDYVAIGPVKH